MKKLHGLKKGDIGLVLLLGFIIILLLGITYHNKKSNSLIAEIKRDGNLVQNIDLNEVQKPQYIELENGIKMTIVAEKGRIRVLHADCPNKICVKTGWLTEPGDIAVCVPSDTTVRIKVP